MHYSINPDQTKSMKERPTLYVDLDGTLTYSDLLFESFLLLIRRNPLYLFCCLFWLLSGRSYLKSQIARRISIDPALLPYNEDLLTFLRKEHAAGRRLVLASASDISLVQPIARYLGIFSGVMGSTETLNLKASNKLNAIKADIQSGSFAYAGNSHADLCIWNHAAETLIINAPPSLTAKVSESQTPTMILPAQRVSWKVYIRALRLHQWAKNLLLFVPLLAAHNLDAANWGLTLLAFLAFGLCASGTYILNDLLDLAADRSHPRKRLRPFASGVLTIQKGLGLVITLVPASLMLAAIVSPVFLGWLLFYTATTLAYSLRLKQEVLVDVLVLALLYTLRILAGGVASEIAVSNWLLAEALFIFLSLALVKRCIELEFMNTSGQETLLGRGYRSTDLQYLISMGIASGFAAMVILALYIESQAELNLYPRAQLLWFVLPVMLYWLMRLWLKTSRMEVHDDPLFFALRDPASWIAAAVITITVITASIGAGG